MICQAILKIRGKEIPILYYSYRCHIQHCDDPNLRRIIQLHIEACEKIGNREYLPVEGDLITLMFECSGDEQFFYDWLNEGVMHNGEIHFVYNEVEIADIFQFWDCFCLKIEESMNTGCSPMLMTVYLSPGIIKRNNLEPREKVWKVSDVMQNINVINNQKEIDESPVLLIRAVEGISSAIVCQTINYHVTKYNIPLSAVTENDKKNIRWIVNVDGKEINLSNKGENLNLYILPEWYDKEIIVMPYLKKHTKTVCVRTKIDHWKLPRLFAMSKNWPGKNENGEIPEDLKYGDITNKEAIRINVLNRLQINASDELLFNELSMLTSVFTLLGGKENVQNLINNFRESKGTTFSSKYMNDALAAHPTLKQFIYEKSGVLENLNEQLRIANGNINNIKMLRKIINSTSPKFSWRSGAIKNIINDVFSGMTIAVDGISAYLIYIDDYKLISANTYDAVLRIEIYDNFGLNPADIQCGFGVIAGFRAWFILQHVRGYKPFLTKMTYKLHIKNGKF